ncbi:MAG: hypothetical protein KGL39_05480 [Patescibacteria group bacterium]|nr:hypothetical protein [Patescibacteria group bacterium]
MIRHSVPRRRPWPFDLIFAGTGVMLGAPSDKANGAPLVATKPQTLDNALPPSFGYSAESPTLGRTQVYSDLSLGYGQRMQQTAADKRYYYATNADLSVQGLWLKGPTITSFTPATVDSANGITQFVEVAGILYALNGRYCLQRASDTSWTVSNDFGVGNAALNGAVFESNDGAVTSEQLFVAMGDSVNIWRYDPSGTPAWQQNSAGMKALSFCAVGQEFWRAYSTNQMAKVSTNADPFVWSNWGDNATGGSFYYVGDKASAITQLVTIIDNGLLALKTDGIYTLDSQGIDHNLFPYLDEAPSSDNGKVWAQWQNNGYVGYGGTLFNVEPEIMFSLRLHLVPMGPEQISSNDSDVRGRITAMAGHDTLNLYAGIYNPDSGNSYLIKLGGYGTDEKGQAAQVMAWHGAISQAFSGKKITALFKSSVGAPTGHSRMYLGFSDGSIAYFTLPCVPNPAACSSYTFSTADGAVYLPGWHGMFIDDLKSIEAVTVSGLNLSGNNWAEFEWRTDASYAFTNLGDRFSANPRQRIEMPANIAGTTIEFCVLLRSTGTSTPATPEMTGLGVEYAVDPPLRLLYTFDVLAANGCVRRDGTPLRATATQIETLIKTASDQQGSISVILPDETTQTVRVRNYSESTSWNERMRRWQSSIHVEAIQFTTGVLYGTWSRIVANAWGDWLKYTWAQLEGGSLPQTQYGTWQRVDAYTWTQLSGTVTFGTWGQVKLSTWLQISASNTWAQVDKRVTGPNYSWYQLQSL